MNNNSVPPVDRRLAEVGQLPHRPNTNQISMRIQYTRANDMAVGSPAGAVFDIGDRP